MYNSHINVSFNLDFDNIEQLRGEDGRFHYFYKIVNKINDNFYYGVHSTKDIYDNYAGSGSVLENAYKKYTERNFTKHIISFFDNRKTLLEYEKIVVNENILNNPKCYNIIEGGAGNYNLDNSYIEHTTLGKIHINNGWKNKLVEPDELQYYLDNGWKRGQTIKSTLGKNLITKNGEELFITPNELQYYLDQGWEKRGKSRNKGKKSFAKNCVWINNGSICKRVSNDELQHYLDQGWKRGSIQKFTKGYVRITNGIEDKNIAPDNINELQHYLDQGWKRGSCARHADGVWIMKDGVNKVIKQSSLKTYLNKGWTRGRLPMDIKDTRQRTCIYKNNELKRVPDDELQHYLDQGWMRGNPKNRGNSHNLGKVRVTDGVRTKTITPDELQHYLDQGWMRGNLHKDNMRNRIRITNGLEEKFIPLEEYEKYDKTVWRRGVLKPRKVKK